MPLLLVNENFPAPATRALRDAGVDVKSIIEVCAGVTDEVVLAMACTEQRWLVTFDRDYGELLFARQLSPPPALILLREPHYEPAEPAIWLLPLLQDPHEVEGYFCVLNRDGLRKRPLLRRIGAGT
jgi:predicted nuclease of predicted toxin-antitoxin system